MGDELSVAMNIVDEALERGVCKGTYSNDESGKKSLLGDWVEMVKNVEHVSPSSILPGANFFRTYRNVGYIQQIKMKQTLETFLAGVEGSIAQLAAILD